MHRLHLRLLIACAASLSVFDRLPAQAPSSPRDSAHRRASQRAPDFFVGVEVNNKTHQYREGDTLSVRIVSEVNAYVHVFYQQADGQEFQIFPNSRQRNNLLKAREAVQIPDQDDDYRWHIGPPFGNERVKVVASRVPFKSLSAKGLTAQRFNPLSADSLKGVAQELGEEAGTTVETPITTFPRNARLDASGARRFGIFFGVADYQFHTAMEAATGKGMRLASPHRDARKLRELLRERGELNDAREFTNEQATRANFEQAVTGWLPSVSRPGDTVFIYFSGHGSVLQGESHKAHFLLPYDVFPEPALDGLRKLHANHQLDNSLLAALSRAETVVNAFGDEEGKSRLVREAIVSDEQFGHWLQYLQGRQVIVILDICYAAGFATHANGQKEIDDPKEFRFLQDQMGRLKDIGQPESALLAASRADETSAVRQEEDLSVMTYELIRTIETGPAPLTLSQAFTELSAGMKRYFSTHVGASKPHEPVLFNYCSRPIYLKP